jgi:hypothetical protein
VILIRLSREPRPARHPTLHGFRIAGHDMVSDVPFPELAAFAATVPPDVRLPAVLEGASLVRERTGEVFRGPAWLCGSTREVTCSVTPRGYDLSVAGVGDFVVGPTGGQIDRTSGETSPSDPAVAETVLGPALTLALALHGTYCLHASAVLSPAGALLLLGPSGAGKSTLGSFLGGAGGGFAPLTDDITPVVMTAAGPEVWPHFPQLKLPADLQPARVAPERIPLRAAYVLDLPGPDAAEDVSIDRLDPGRSLAVLVRHTVAVRLFGRSLMAAYLSLIGSAWSMPLRPLSYPRRFETLSTVAAAIAADFKGA